MHSEVTNEMVDLLGFMNPESFTLSWWLFISEPIVNLLGFMNPDSLTLSWWLFISEPVV